MGNLVISGAKLMCSFGSKPSDLKVLPVNRTMCSNMPAAIVMDYLPMVNIMPFGMCSCLANPMVAAATAAALGVLTPMPCIPVTTQQWSPGSPTDVIGYMNALNDSSTCSCNWGGVITISVPGQMNTMVP